MKIISLIKDKIARKNPSVLEALHQIFSTEQIMMMTGELQQPTEMISALAKIGNKNESDILLELGSACKLQVVLDVPEFDISLLPPSITEDKLLRAGVAIQTAPLKKYYCVSPEFSSLYIDGLTEYECILAPFHEIKKSIQKSFLIKKFPELHDVELACFLIEFLKFAHEHNTYHASLTCNNLGQIAQYSLVRSDESKAEGVINLGENNKKLSCLFEAPNELIQRYCIALCEIEGITAPISCSIESESTLICILKSKDSRSNQILNLTIEQNEEMPATKKDDVSNHQDVTASESISDSATLSVKLPECSSSHTKSQVVLLVEDSEVYSKVLKRFLLRHQIEVQIATNGIVAIDLIRNGLNPALVISDFHMTEMNGDELIHCLRHSIEVTKNTPIIALTSDVEPEAEMKLISRGANCLLRKDVDSRVLLTYVKRYLHLTESQEAA